MKRRPDRHPSARTVLTARSPDDLVAVASVVLGFWPEESIVMLTFDAVRPFHARVDLPGPADPPEAAREVAAMLVAPAVRHGVGRVVLLVYSDDAERAATAHGALAEAFAGAGIDVVEALRVGGDRWFPLDAGPAHAGAPYDVSDHPFVVQSVVEGRVTHASRGALARTLDTDPRGLARVRARLASLREADDVVAESAWAAGVVVAHLDAGTAAPDDEAARLLVGLGAVPVRDAVWSVLTRERAREAVELLADLVRRAPDEHRAPVAALLAWAAWQSGDGALAWCAVDRARAVEPGHGLAGLVAEALTHAVPPSATDPDPGRRAGRDAG
ncbi:DUF4192 domain-containing protein [Nocardioides marinquilinus]